MKKNLLNGTHDYLFIKNFDKNVLSWDDIFQNFNESVERNELIKFKQVAAYVIHNANRIEALKNILHKLNCTVAHIYLNLCAEKINFGRHNDDMDVWFWQCQGLSRWVLDDKEFTLEPGDLIYVKKGIYHNVSALTPRAGVSMSRN